MEMDTTINSKEPLPAEGMQRKHPDYPAREVFEAAKSGDAVLLNEVLQEMNSSERTSALETKMAASVLKDELKDEFNVGGKFKNELLYAGAYNTTPLIVSVENGNLDCVKVLLKYKADIEGRGDDFVWYYHFDEDFKSPNCNRSFTPLFVAAAKGNLDILRCLIENGADIDSHITDKCTPLMIAIDKGHFNVVTFLIEHGANLELQDGSGYTAVHHAVRNICDSCDVSILSCLIKNGADVNTTDDFMNCTPLMTASRKGLVNVATFLIEHGADVDLQDKDGKTALHYAVDHEQDLCDVVSCLIKNGADVNARGSYRFCMSHFICMTPMYNCTPLMIASKHGLVNVVTFLIEHGAIVDLQDKAGKTALHYAVDLKHYQDLCDVVSCLIRNGADVNARTDDNCTPLMLASYKGHPNVVSFLIKHGANIDLQDERGYTAVHYAVLSELDCKHYCDVLSCLIKNGADGNACATYFYNYTPLMIASRGGLMNVVAFLIEYGANIQLQDKYGKTALHHAVNHKCACCDVLSCLIKNGADVNACDYDNCTPLLIASDCGNVDAVNCLLQHGACIQLQDKDGKTALHYAVYALNGCLSCHVLSSLIKNGADVNSCTNTNCTPLMMASCRGYVDLVAFLIEHGADMDLQDTNGDTALHYAVPTVFHKLLSLGASQLCNNQQLTPILSASNKCMISEVEYFFTRPECTKEQRIDALELLGASLATSEVDPCLLEHKCSIEFNISISKGFEYMKRGMEERFADPSHPLLKQSMEPVEAYQNRMESQTLEELAQIKNDTKAILMESLLIRERILGTNKTLLLGPIRSVAGYYEHRNHFIWIELHRHAMKIAQSCNQSAICDLLELTSLLSSKSMWRGEVFLELLEQTVLEYDKQQKLRRGLENKSHKLQIEETLQPLFDSTMKLLEIIAKFINCEEGKTLNVLVLLKRLSCLNPRDKLGNTLLHKAVEHCTTGAFPCIHIVKLLLNAGFNVNAVNNNGDTLLHIAVTFAPSYNFYDDDDDDNDERDDDDDDESHVLTDMLEVLLDGGAHRDFVNNDGETAMDMAQTVEARRILSEETKLELKCISARAVKKFGLPYLGMVPKTLEKYISMH